MRTKLIFYCPNCHFQHFPFSFTLPQKTAQLQNKPAVHKYVFCFLHKFLKAVVICNGSLFLSPKTYFFWLNKFLTPRSEGKDIDRWLYIVASQQSTKASRTTNQIASLEVACSRLCCGSSKTRDKITFWSFSVSCQLLFPFFLLVNRQPKDLKKAIFQWGKNIFFEKQTFIACHYRGRYPLCVYALLTILQSNSLSKTLLLLWALKLFCGKKDCDFLFCMVR